MRNARIVMIIPIEGMMAGLTPEQIGNTLCAHITGLVLPGFTLGEIDTFKVVSVGESGIGSPESPPLLPPGCRQGEAMFDGLDGRPDLLLRT